MRASVGDRIVIKGHHVGEPTRDAEVLEVHGEDGAPPYLVRWSDDGHEGLFFPGSDASVQRFEHGEPTTVAPPPGPPRARELSVDECLELLETHQLGRVAVPTDAAPVIVPVNYRLARTPAATWLAFRTRLGGIVERCATYAAFEIDETDDETRTGWSVLVRGTLHHVDPDTADFRERFDSDPWVGDREAWMIVEPYAIEGRRLESVVPSAS